MGEWDNAEGLTDLLAERSLLAVSAGDASAWATSVDIVQRDDFTSLERGSIWAAICETYSNSRTPDDALILSLAANCEKELHAVNSLTSTPSNCLEYAERVRKLSELRHLQKTCRTMLQVIDKSADPDHVVSQGMERMLSVVTRSTQERQTVSYGDLMTEYVEIIKREKLAREAGEMTGITFGFDPVDSYTMGMRPDDGDLMILAGDPGAGKTAFAMSILRRFATIQAKKSKPVGALMLSLEMGRYATAMRWSQMAAGLTTEKLRGSITDAEISKLSNSLNQESKIPLWVNFAEDLYVDQLKAVIANAVRKHNVKIVVIDHLRYLNMRGRHDQMELDELRVRYVKQNILKPLGVAGIVLAHSTKAASSRDDKTPQMDDLRGSRQIAATADTIAFVYRPYMVSSADEKANGVYTQEESYLVWRKSRNSALGNARFEFHGDTMRVDSASSWGEPPTQKAPEAPAQQSLRGDDQEW